MSKLLTGVFLGVFVGALGYELVSRNRPDIIAKIRKKVSEKVDTFMEPTENGEIYEDFDEEEAPEPLV